MPVQGSTVTTCPSICVILSALLRRYETRAKEETAQAYASSGGYFEAATSLLSIDCSAAALRLPNLSLCGLKHCRQHRCTEKLLPEQFASVWTFTTHYAAFDVMWAVG